MASQISKSQLNALFHGAFITPSNPFFKKSLDDLPLPPQQIGKLKAAGYDTVQDLEGMTPDVLSKDLGIDLNASQAILTASQRPRMPPPTQSAATLRSEKSRQYSTYCKPLDTLLNGGITQGSILEISGPPGTVKEALAINISRSFIETGHEVLFVDFQNMTPAARLHEVLDRYSPNSELFESQASHFSIFNLSDFLIFIHQLPSNLHRNVKIRLLVLNSLWFPFQPSSDLSGRTRNALLQRMQETLSKVCASTGISVVVTTQLATKLTKDDGTLANFETGSKAILVPQPGNPYLPPGKSFRVIIIPHSRTTGVLRLLSAPAHVRSRNPNASSDQSYEMVDGSMQ